MSNPIEWTATETQTHTRTRRCRLAVEEYGPDGRYLVASGPAAAADLAAALGAMPTADRAAVLGAFWGDLGRLAVERDKAERESRCFADSAAANLAELHRAEVRIEGLMAELNKAARERDEARRELDRARASLDVVRHDLNGTRQELGEARKDRDSLRARIIAAESAAAAREPREYPLAEGSPPPSIDPERLDLVRRALSGYVDPDQSPEQAARVAVEVADVALAIMRGIV